jgi:hypothetical protein
VVHTAGTLAEAMVIGSLLESEGIPSPGSVSTDPGYEQWVLTKAAAPVPRLAHANAAGGNQARNVIRSDCGALDARGKSTDTEPCKQHHSPGRCRAIAPPAAIATAAAAAHGFGDASHRGANSTPLARAAMIHSAGSFTCGGEAGPQPPCEMFAETNRKGAPRKYRSRFRAARPDRARASAARKTRR